MLIGFAAETDDLEANAVAKREAAENKSSHQAAAQLQELFEEDVRERPRESAVLCDLDGSVVPGTPGSDRSPSSDTALVLVLNNSIHGSRSPLLSELTPTRPASPTLCAAGTSNTHWRNNLILGENALPAIFAVTTFTSYTSSDYNGFRPNPGAAVSFRWCVGAARRATGRGRLCWSTFAGTAAHSGM